jgi:electron transport complex protein RnfD
MSLLTNSSPHQHGPQSLQALMLRVLFALVPGIAVYAWLISPAVLVQIGLAIVTALVCEGLVLKLRSRPVLPVITDGSAIVTAVLLALAIPPLAPWWIIVLGTAFAIIFGKQLFGGLGYNPFNPAMLGYAMLLISFPLQMTDWNIFGLYTRIFTEVQILDAVSGATPLDSLRTQLTLTGSLPDSISLFADNNWHWLSLAYVAGGVWLLWRRDIAWQIPLALLLSVAVFSGIFWLIDPARYSSPLFHLFSGATMLAAFFIATDPVSAATTPRGRLIYAAGIGIIICVIRNWGGYPDGVAFAVLLMNMAAPSIDHFTRPRVFGQGG